MSDKKSLQDSCGLRFDIYLLWTVSFAALIAGLYMPVITFTELIFKKSTFSILSGIADLYEHGEHALAFVILLFSVFFPVIKLLSLLLLWFIPIYKNNRNAFVSRLGDMGKWSMLDVYVVAMTIVIAKSSALVKAEPETGLYLFGAAAVLSIITSSRIGKLSKKVS